MPQKMRFRAAHLRQPFHGVLALVAVAALAHCSWEGGRELAQRCRSLAQQRLGLAAPVEAPVHDCNHEFGCICRGATQVAAIDVAHFQALPIEMLPLDVLPAVEIFAADDAPALWSSAWDHDALVPAISGRQLRALYASLVI